VAGKGEKEAPQAADDGHARAKKEKSVEEKAELKPEQQRAKSAEEAPAAPAKQTVKIEEAPRGEERVAMSPIRRRIAARLVEAQQNAALLTTFNEANMSAVKQLRAQHGEAFERRHGVRLGFMPFFVKAAVDALRQCPELNAMIDGDDIVYHRSYDIGVAISTNKGLVVPVLRNAERMSFAQIEQAIDDLSKRARLGELKVDELQGGTFTITNGGVFGSLLSTPIVNPPQSGVLGMHAIQNRPVAIDNQVAIRPMMYLALTYDHRIVDGREAVTFLRRIKETIEDPSRLLIEA
jgi:2-oxoglutarate dehydrogenase E2 component (dihydrolipoamide succinyltransferase)